MGGSNSFAGNRRLLRWDDDKQAYATIPIAAAYALQTNLFKRILVLDEYITVEKYADLDTLEEYYRYGNGALFYSQFKKKTAALFNGKIITQDKINHKILWNFLRTDGQDIDLVFYNIDASKVKHTDQRKPNITSLFLKHIPIVFILSDTYNYNATEYIVKYIAKTASEMSTILTPTLENNLHNLQIILANYYLRDASKCKFVDIYSPEHSSDTDDNWSLSESESEESDDNDYDLDPFVFKITTNIAETKTCNGANYTLLAKDISFTNNGVMEVILAPNYEYYSTYKCYTDFTSTSSSDDELLPHPY